MNTLTKNRIIEKGDEYRDNGTWKPIPANDYGLQIMFTKYAEVRRPSEEPPSTQGSVAATRLAHNQETVGSNPTPAKPISPCDHITTKYKDQCDKYGAYVAPISPAESVAPATSTPTAEKETSTPVPAPSGAGGSPINGSTDITWNSKEPECIWTGRNGTFKCRGLKLYNHADGNVIKIVPVGKRGVAKNAEIEFPTAAIPQVVDWLLRQQK